MSIKKIKLLSLLLPSTFSAGLVSHHLKQVNSFFYVLNTYIGRKLLSLLLSSTFRTGLISHYLKLVRLAQVSGALAIRDCKLASREAALGVQGLCIARTGELLGRLKTLVMPDCAGHVVVVRKRPRFVHHHPAFSILERRFSGFTVPSPHRDKLRRLLPEEYRQIDILSAAKIGADFLHRTSREVAVASC